MLHILHKHVSAIVLKGKMGSDTAGAFKTNFIRQCTCRKLQTDGGKVFLNQAVYCFNSLFAVHHLVPSNKAKAFNVKYFNRLLITESGDTFMCNTFDTLMC